jgi:Concanavalin A-like lectin/glucanases superfamily
LRVSAIGRTGRIVVGAAAIALAVGAALPGLGRSGLLAAPGHALELDGSDDEARGGAIAGTAGVQTVEAWVRPARLAYSIFLVNSDDKTGWLMETDDQGHAKFWAADSQGAWKSAPNWRVTVQAGAWQHVAAVYDGARMQTFVNGVGGGWYDLGRMSAGPFLRIGGLRPYPFFAGQLDEVRISSGLRYGGDFTPPSAPFAPDASTLALYHLDEASGQTILDASGRGNHLTRGTTQGAEAADPAWVPSTAPLSGAGGGTDPTNTPPTSPTGIAPGPPKVAPGKARQHLPIAPRSQDGG